MTASELVGQSFGRGWNAFTHRPRLMIGTVVVVFGISIISGAIAQSASETAAPGASFLFNVGDFFIVQILISMGLIAWSLKAAENTDAVQFSHLWSPHPYWKFLGASILVTIIELIGFVLFIVPGIIAAVMLLFAPFIVMDRKAGPIEAVTASFNIVKHHFWSIFLLLLAVLVVNIAGALAFGVGLFVSVPVTVIAIAHAYKTLAQITPSA